MNAAMSDSVRECYAKASAAMKRQCVACSAPEFGAMDGLSECGVFGVFGSYLKSTVFGGFRNALSRRSPGVRG